jgi:hypothetical protein
MTAYLCRESGDNDGGSPTDSGIRPWVKPPSGALNPQGQGTEREGKSGIIRQVQITKVTAREPPMTYRKSRDLLRTVLR